MIFHVRPMSADDLDRVQEIDKLSFNLPWPLSAFRYELHDNHASSCWVVEAQDVGASGVPAERTSPGGRPVVVAMAVVWWVIDEAHIATIAVHPDVRGQGVGKLLLTHILQDAIQRGMLVALLEVRAGNQVAQQMYRQFGFVEVGRRPRYYRDNDEDALLMNLELKEESREK